ncbi:hypothetical protein P3T40_002848 [Paraburkholderia sp. EB58]|jgi:hypothetical protein|uniref:DUF6236 family protein n=1 Tax=Paraburkholderia sp. EB58 TaxID=3035125 RepID=UPI003D225072
MRNNALYFPYISVPNERWTIKTLLYWDKLSSIVPMEYIDRPEALDDFMRRLVEAGMVEQLFPAQYLQHINEFEKLFVELVDRQMGRTHVSPTKHEVRRIRIHVEKLGNIPEYLLDRGLATRVSYAWYDVDEPVANLFMAYLASCLGSIPEIDAAPVTNKLAFANLFGGGSRLRVGERMLHQQKAREVVLTALLPFPDESVTLDQLVAFKERHGHLLPALRQLVEARCALIAELDDVEHRLIATQQLIDESRQQVDELVDAMRPNWAKIAFGSLVPLLATGLAIKSGDFASASAATTAGLQYAATAYQSLTAVHGLSGSQQLQPLAFIAHARTELHLPSRQQSIE